ncbi:MAG: hypothetical protein NPIRA01_02890 [Nitrospirales bacterium]|nr:MAG: hypothetical protein NPIRA01_02890 [Nitrospirales bacterium]
MTKGVSRKVKKTLSVVVDLDGFIRHTDRAFLVNATFVFARTRMNEGQEQREPQSPRDQAISWFLHLQSEEATAHDLQRHESWLRENPVHRKEYEQVSAMWKDFDQLSPQVMEKYRVSSRPRAQIRKGWALPSLGMTRSWRLPAALTVALVVFVLSVWWWPYSFVSEESYLTVKGEQRTINLADGSTIFMNTDSQIIVQLSDDERVVKLQQGEVLFTVAHDQQRPFTVYAGNGMIQDIGTQFLIRQSSTNVNVAVLEGVVEVEIKEGTDIRSTQKSKILRQGDQLVYQASGLMSSIQSFDRDMVLAWTEAQLYFEAKPLKEVIDEWSRYGIADIRLQDPSLGRIPVSGKFRIDHLQSFFQALDETLSIRARYITPQHVILERKAHT